MSISGIRRSVEIFLDCSEESVVIPGDGSGDIAYQQILNGEMVSAYVDEGQEILIPYESICYAVATEQAETITPGADEMCVTGD